MPGLNDKIFLPISIFTLNVVLAIFNFVLVSAVAACFIIYARYGGEYASSVRWIRSAGYLEMIHTLKSTLRRKNIPGSVKWALTVGILVTLAASFLDKGIAAFVTPATRYGPPRKEVVASTLSRPDSDNSRQIAFYGWNFLVPRNGDVLGTMMTVLNSSIVLSKSVVEQTYTPVTSAYNITCADFGIKFQGEGTRESSGCATVTLFSGFPEDVQAIRTERSPSRGSIIMASPSLGVSMIDKPLRVSTEYGSVGKCHHEESYRRSSMEFFAGFALFPTTSTTKCFYNTSDITAVTMTTTRFRTSGYRPHEVNYYLTDESNELILAMNETIRTTTMPSPPGQQRNETKTELWIEYRVTKSTIDILACGPPMDVDSRECIYGTINILLFRNHFNNDIKKVVFKILDRKRRDEYDFTSYITLESFTDIMDIGEPVPASTEKMRSDTVAVADYMAQLGYNYYAEITWALDRVHIQYDVKDLILGLEIPFWVLVIAGIILIVSLLLWQLTNLLVGPPHHSSLYSIIRNRIASRSDTPTPRLMRFRFEPLMFDDVQLLPDDVKNDANTRTV
ncbi:MAG: hypothetical protein J3Q66DRAFT_398199 [Benniella sp.]|nr:MAG: hypothetical protein J3Q66DRAFT_398199 [Benniella sp.]